MRDIIDLAKIGYYYFDNVTVNDVIIQIIYNRFKFNILKPRKRRVKYLNYIINLTAIAFLFSYDQKFIKAKISSFNKIDYFKTQLAF
jgi:uncharacterized protein YebE (UPF0316 family)